MNTEDHGLNSAHASYERGSLLHSQHRYDDAAAMFQQALQADPNHAPSYTMLAVCWMRDDAKTAQAVDAARRAVALDTENSYNQSVLAVTVANHGKAGQTGVIKEALGIATHAIELDPDSSFAHAVQASLFLRLRKYPEAEAAAKKSLALDMENEWASEVLSTALMQQHKDEDNAGLVRYQLENRPESDSSHASAGWLALRQGRHKEANQHFSEALRLNPMNEGARMGLVESYRARSIFYGTYVRFAHAMSRFSEGSQAGIMIGGFIAYRILKGYLTKVAPFWAGVLVAVWLTLVLWSHLARGVGSFCILFDKFARRALRKKEAWEGAAVGGCVFLALGSLALSLKIGPDGNYAALALFFSAVVSAAAFTNDHHVGKYVYGTAAVLAGIGALITVSSMFLPLPFGGLAFAATVLLGVAVSWLRPFNFLYA